MNDDDDKQTKLLHNIFLDFFRDCSIKFKGRVDDGSISLKELNDYIHSWISVHFKDRK